MMINTQDTSWFVKPVWQLNWQHVNDSLQAEAVQHVSASAGSNELEKIVSGLEEMSKFGIGFGDVLSLIAIPLIIALFAFAFPFLFSVITHIHNKYESERISQMLSGSAAYKWFLWLSGGSAAFLVVIAIIAIALAELTWYSTTIKIVECIGVVVAAGYSYVIGWFVYTCIKYNQPETLIELIHERYGIEKKELDKYQKRLDKKEKKLEKLSEGERYVLETGSRLGRIWLKEGVEELRSKRLVALASHALNTRNSQLFQKILTYVSTISKDVKMEEVIGASYSVNMFYLGCMDAYFQIPEDAKVEESLQNDWFQSISRCRIPWERGIADMLSKIVHAAKIGREGLMERYFQDAAWRFDFLHLLPAVSFVRGDEEAMQQEMNHEARCTMDDICKIHYFVAAYLFAEGYYKTIKYALPKRGGARKLLPYFADEVLWTYAKCKRELGGSGDYYEWYVDVIVGRKVEADILERYTVFRLMTAAEMYSPYHIMMGDAEWEIIENNRKVLCKFAKLLQSESELTSLFPVILNVKFDNLLTDCMEKMRDNEFMQERKEKNDVIGRIIDRVGKLCCEKQKEKGKKRIYDVVIPQLTYDNLEIHAGNMIFGNRGMVTNGIEGVNSEDKTETLELGKYTHTASKWALLEAIPFNMHLIFGQLTNVFRARYYYLLLQAIRQMDVEEQYLTPDKFGVYLQQLVKDKGEDYMLIDCNSAMTSFMKYDKHDREENEDWYRHVTTYLKANVQHLDIETSDYLRDLKGIRDYQGALLIIMQKDIPYLDAIVAGERCKLTCEDNSDKPRAIADVKITVDSNYLIRYCKKTKVIKVFTEKMNLT